MPPPNKPPAFIPDTPSFVPDAQDDFHAAYPDIGFHSDLELRPRPTGPIQTPLNWLEDLQYDVKHGTDLTLPGRALKFMGAEGTDKGAGAQGAVGDLMPGGGTIQGVAKLAHGAGRILQGHPILGGNEILRGFGQAAAPVLAVTQPEFLPSAVTYGAAGAGIEGGLKAVGVSPETSEFVSNVVTGLLGGREALGDSETKRVNRLSFASGKGTTGPIEATLADVNRAVAKNGPPKTVGDFLSAVKTAKTDLNNEYGNALGPNANRMAPFDADGSSPISRRILDLITPNMEQTARGRQEAAMIKRAAAEFQKPWTLGQLDAERMDANARLNAYEKKNIADQYASQKGNRSVAIDKAIADGVRDVVYPFMDKLSGKPEGYFRNIKGRIGNLIQLESSLDQEVERLHDLTARTKGAPALSRARVRTNVGESGSPRFWMSNVLGALHAPNEEATANRAVAGSFGQPSWIPGIMALPVKALLTGDYQTQ